MKSFIKPRTVFLFGLVYLMKVDCVTWASRWKNNSTSGVVDHQSARTDLVEVRFECVATNHEVGSSNLFGRAIISMTYSALKNCKFPTNKNIKVVRVYVLEVARKFYK